SGDLPCPDKTLVQVALPGPTTIYCPGDQGKELFEAFCGSFCCYYLTRTRGIERPSRAANTALNDDRITLARLNNGLFIGRVGATFACDDKACSHFDSGCTEGKCGSKAAGVANASCGKDRNLHGIDNAWYQDKC